MTVSSREIQVTPKKYTFVEHYNQLSLIVII